MNRYRVVGPRAVLDAEPGDVLEVEFTAEEEHEHLVAGRLKIMPQTYRVIGGSYVHNTAPGETFERALRIGEEALLIEGGHIERVEAPPTKKRAKEE